MSTKESLLEKILSFYQSDFDIDKPYYIHDDYYDAHARFEITNAKYVLIKKAELWRALCFEHVFFRITDNFNKEELIKARKHILNYIEPELVRKGARWPEPNHMYTYITFLFICENGVQPEALREIKKFRFEKNYLFTIRGYSLARILVFDLKGKKIYGNKAAKPLIKGYKKAGIF